MTEETRAKIHELLDVCIDSDTDVFFYYAPHINGVQVYRYNTKKWAEDSKPLESDTVYCDEPIASEFDEIIKKVNEYDNA